MLGSIGSWLYKHAAGLDVADDAVGSDRLVMRPLPNESIASASVELQTLRGRAALAWQQQGGELAIEASVPSGAVATLEIPWKQSGRGEVVLENGRVLWPPDRAVPVEAVYDLMPQQSLLRMQLGSGTFKLRRCPA
jgi:alpha-L-rhamnosidase